jgi:hypothetical protein
MSKHVLGPRIIGAAASAEAQRKLVDDKGGGSIQLGDRLLKQRDRGATLGRPVHPAKVKAPAEATEEVVASVAAETGVAPAAPDAKPKRRPKPKPTDAGLSENDIADMLADDPNRWDTILETEAKRPEGFRPRVAQMVLNAAPEAKAKPMPDDVRAHLERLAGVGAKADADKLAKAAAIAAATPVTAPEATPSV